MKSEILIKKCSDTSMWYADKIGQRVPYIKTLFSEKCFLSREDAGFVNVVKFDDAELVVNFEKEDNYIDFTANIGVGFCPDCLNSYQSEEHKLNCK